MPVNDQELKSTIDIEYIKQGDRYYCYYYST